MIQMEANSYVGHMAKDCMLQNVPHGNCMEKFKDRWLQMSWMTGLRGEKEKFFLPRMWSFLINGFQSEIDLNPLMLSTQTLLGG